ncbi:MAG: peptide ABC transporter substrate-binding protein [Clostridiales bacterium]|nr:peptide ABC transporter substrate-binding protein [Clostridiales bacterium]
MKKHIALLLALLLLTGMLSSCAKKATPGTESPGVSPTSSPGQTEEPNPIPDWRAYDELIAQIKTSTDYAQRETLMHQAEDMLMKTYCIIPIYYYNDIYMLKPEVSGLYSNAYGIKYFMYTDAPNNKIRLLLGSEPDRLDPALNSTVDGATLAANSFAGLYRYDAEGNLVPDLAESHTVSDDELTYTFTLKEGLKWSDGSELNANDFVYSWKRAADPATGADYSYMLNSIAGFADNDLQVSSSEDGRHFTVVLSAPTAYFLDLCAFPTFLPVKQSEVEGAPENETNPGAWALEAGFISNGAYMLESWAHNENMVYVKNPNYWDADNVKTERLELMLSSDDAAVFAAYNAGDLDFIDTVPTDEIAALLNDPQFHIVDQLGTYYISINIKSDLFSGKTVEQANAMRQAFSLLIDRDFIVENIAQTGQQPANTFIPPSMLDGHGGEFKSNDTLYTYPDAESVGYYNPFYSEDNIDKAKSLLESAGFKFDQNGALDAATPISFEYLTNETSAHIAIAEAIQQDLGVLGINMTLKAIDFSVFVDERKAGNYDIARNGWIADFNDPINMLEMWTTESGNNDCQFGK